MTHQPDPKPKAMPIDKACSYIGVGKTTLYGLIKGKRLKVCKLGRKTLVFTADLEALLDDLAKEAA